MGFSGNLEKLKIIAYQKDDFKKSTGPPPDPPPIFVYINPAKYSRKYKICYTAAEAAGSISGAQNYQKTPSDKLELDLVFDGTGVVPSPLPGVVPFADDGIVKQVREFLDLTYTYQGKIHSPYFLEVVWGTLLFRCQLESFAITYTLFKPDGTPLRATAKVVFKEYINRVQQEKVATKMSPDVSHFLTVEAGDTLPQMCYNIYGSSVYYPQVAKVNGLSDFRNLSIGSRLLFPPLAGAPQ